MGTGGAPEWRALGLSEKRRGVRADEALELLTRLWSEEAVDFEGEFYRYEAVTIAPRPIQQPLPLWIGGSSPAAIRRTARLGSGWLAGIQTPAEVAPVVAAIREASSEAGRAIDPEHYGAGFPFRFGDSDDPSVQRTAAGFKRFRPDFDLENYLAVGGADAVVARLDAYRQAGVTKFVLRPVADDADGLLDQTRRLAEEVLPAIPWLTGYLLTHGGSHHRAEARAPGAGAALPGILAP